MKTKIQITALLAVLTMGALSINAAENGSITGNVETKYSSDHFRRGDLLSAETIQAQVGFYTSLSDIEFFGDFSTSQGTGSSGANTDEARLGLGTSFLDDRLSTYLGVYNTDHSANQDSSLEGFLEVSINTVLTPTVRYYQDVDDDLETVEGQLSYNVDLDLVNLGIAGALGSADTLVTENQTYTSLTATLSRSIGDNLNVFADMSLSDTDARDHDSSWGIGLNLKF